MLDYEITYWDSDGKLVVSQVARKYGIPDSTLRDNLEKLEIETHSHRGGPKVLTDEEELILYNTIKISQQRYLPVTPKLVKDWVQTMLKDSQKQYEKDKAAGKPVREWYVTKGFVDHQISG